MEIILQKALSEKICEIEKKSIDLCCWKPFKYFLFFYTRGFIFINLITKFVYIFFILIILVMRSDKNEFNLLMGEHLKNIFDSIKYVINGEINLEDLSKIQDNDDDFNENLAEILEEKFQFLTENNFTKDEFLTVLKIRKEEYNYYLKVCKFIDEIKSLADNFGKGFSINMLTFIIINFCYRNYSTL